MNHTSNKQQEQQPCLYHHRRIRCYNSGIVVIMDSNYKNIIDPSQQQRKSLLLPPTTSTSTSTTWIWLFVIISTTTTLFFFSSSRSTCCTTTTSTLVQVQQRLPIVFVVSAFDMMIGTTRSSRYHCRTLVTTGLYTTTTMTQQKSSLSYELTGRRCRRSRCCSTTTTTIFNNLEQQQHLFTRKTKNRIINSGSSTSARKYTLRTTLFRSNHNDNDQIVEKTNEIGTKAATLSSSSSSLTPSVGGDNNDNDINNNSLSKRSLFFLSLSPRSLGLSVLCTVPLAWGTYGPVVKYLYTIEPPVPGLLFSAAYYIVAATTLWTCYIYQNYHHKNKNNNKNHFSKDKGGIENNNNQQLISTVVSSSSTTVVNRSSRTTTTTTSQRKQQQLFEEKVVDSTLSTTSIATTESTNNRDSVTSSTAVPSYTSNLLLSQSSSSSFSSSIQGGVELGSYLFIGNLLQVIGLQTVPADRAGFLVQLTTIFVPLLQATISRSLFSIPLRTWMACSIALLGVIIIDLDGHEQQIIDYITQTTTTTVVAIPSSPLVMGVQDSIVSTGDLLIMLAAFVYSLHVVRLGKYAKQSTPLQLAACKATMESILSVGLVILLLCWQVTTTSTTSMSIMNDNDTITSFVTNGVGTQDVTTTLSILNSYLSETALSIQNYWNTIIQIQPIITSDTLSSFGPTIGAIFWTGWITCAYTIYAQSFGQSRVEPTEANLLYTLQPIFTAAFAYILVGETLGPLGVVGGSCIGLAVYLVATAPTITTTDTSTSTATTK